MMISEFVRSSAMMFRIADSAVTLPITNDGEPGFCLLVERADVGRLDVAGAAPAASAGKISKSRAASSPAFA